MLGEMRDKFNSHNRNRIEIFAAAITSMQDFAFIAKWTQGFSPNEHVIWAEFGVRQLCSAAALPMFRRPHRVIYDVFFLRLSPGDLFW